MSWKETYAKKLVSVEEAAQKIKSNDRVWYPPAGCAPVSIIEALTKRAKELENVQMSTALPLYPFEYLKGEYKDHLSHHTVFLGPFERKVMPQGNIEVTSCQFGDIDWITKNRIDANVFIAEVSPPDENGYMSYGVIGTFNGETAAKIADTVIVQVNREMPYVYGESHSFIHVNDVDYICEQDHKLAQLQQPPVSDVEKQIASYIVPYIEDGSTIQIGLGGVANAVGFFLENHKDLGVHTEMLTDSMVNLAEKGIINGSKKTLHPGEMTVSFGIGSQKLYEFMNNNPQVRTYPISYITNEEIIRKNNKFVSINNALMCDLTGQLCSESIGFDQFSGTGGQLNFVRGAFLAPGGKSFLAFRSVAEQKDGSLISRITASFVPGSVVTTPRSDTQYVVTEYGVADLRGKSIPERVKALVAIAHPQFREELMNDAKKYGLLY
ncbi:4-hydroxybutyrate CoA-transferase [Anaerospora hongkongensis]|uniref:4-hydroxybutyrate CoA-transferase n=1 Tax=Anaerospora hongkongensis TaxID=244830 RepID=A0A4R1Q095_9FIRM|nr:acetyl-CoA hydrolase/transferase C-terminal domain-containing protein [Anaerospora hongkongensis]TCL38865.1 4-hydroxybutyrate CoA-transferase [Anaerospora hongkongensis]